MSMNTEKNIAVIPARKGSKRLKNKNKKLLAGKPLIAYSIEYAIANKHILDEILVTSDDEEILDIAESYGVLPIERPEELASDTATSADVLQHAVRQVSTEQGNNVILLQPTNPLRPDSLLDSLLHFKKSESFSSVFTVKPMKEKYGSVKNHIYTPENYKYGQRSQDLDERFSESGLLYITDSELILEGIIFETSSGVLPVNNYYCNVDIDTEFDFMLAEFIINNNYDYKTFY